MGIWVYFVAIMNNADVNIRAHMCEHKFSFRLGIYIYLRMELQGHMVTLVFNIRETTNVSLQ